MAARFWVGGTGTWDATAGSKWATTSGGAGGATVPGSLDDVYFDALSTGTVTIPGSAQCQILNCTGFTGTITGSGSLSIFSNLTLFSAMTWSFMGTLTMAGFGGTLTTAGKTFGSVTIQSAPVTLNGALTATGLTLSGSASFSTSASSYSLTVTGTIGITSNSGSGAILSLNNSTVTLAGVTPLTLSQFGFTLNAGTSTIILSGNVTTFNPQSGNLTFYNISFTNTTAATRAFTYTAILTYNRLTVAAPSSAGVTQVTFAGPSTFNDGLATSGTAGNRRVWFQGTTYGLAQTLTVNGAGSLTDADFRDIYVIGTAAPISGTRIGDLRGCRGITFDAPKTVYWNLAGINNWTSDAWAATPSGVPSTNNFPLAQDTAAFTNSGAITQVNAFGTTLAVGTVDMSSRTSAMTIQLSNAGTLYGDWKNGSGTTVTNAVGLTFSGRNTQTITSAGKTFPGGITVDSYGGTVQLADALNISTGTLTVTNGTFNTQNYNVTAGSLSSNNSNVRTITLGSSTVTLSQTSGLNFGNNTNLTFNAGTSQITTLSNNPTIDGGTATAGVTFYNVTLNGATSGNTQVISGLNTFNNLTITAPAGTGVLAVTFDANQTITGTLTCSGATAVRRIFLRSNVLGTQRGLTVGTLVADDCDFRDIEILGAAIGTAPTRAGDCGSNAGITFPAAKTVYWNLAGTQNWSATGWAPSSGGTPAVTNFPLAQDTAVFDNTGTAGTVTIDAAWNIGTFDASLRTTAMTFSTSTFAPFVYGDWKFGTGVTSSSTTGTITFASRGTETITSNGVTFGCPIAINSFTGTVQLADALTLNAARTLTLTSGTFDAVSYNVTVFGFIASAGGIIRMGSGTWTLAGTGTIWNCSGGSFLYRGTANIVLSDSSTTGRTFTGGGLSYGKLTIGGTTGTSTLTISGDNQFAELASTKTVAHTISLGTTTQTLGAWTITGTAGNVVTLTGTGISHILAGACTSGIDYLAMGSIGFASTSPGEFYAGANSTGTAAAPVYRTAKPADSTRYWVGGTGNWSDTARWSTSSGGASGASVPRSHDDVIFNAASNATAYTATVNVVTGGIRFKALTISGPASGSVTLFGSAAIVGIHGSVTLPATGLIGAYNGDITLSGSASGKIFTTNGVTFSSSIITVNGISCGWSLGGAFAGSSLILTNGSFDTASYGVTLGSITASITNVVTLSLGSSTVALSTAAGVNFQIGVDTVFPLGLTLNSGTSTISLSSATLSFYGGNKSFYNVVFSSTSAGSVTISGANTFNNLSVTGITSAGLKIVGLSTDQTINGTLTLSVGTDATMRTFVRSNTLGTTRTLTCAAVASLTDIDFRDIALDGAAAPVSGTRLGDCKGNSGITFPAAKTVYWRNSLGGDWGQSAATWSLTNGGTASVNALPLAQDTAIFTSSYPNIGATVNLFPAYNIGTIDMSARTANTMTLATTTLTPAIYGNWINGTGTTLTGTGTLTFAGRGSQTITSAGGTFTQPLTINSPGGVTTLQDAFSATNSTYTLTTGTFDANGYNVTITNGGGLFAFSGAGTKTVAIGSGTWSFPSTSGTFWNAGATGTTVTGTGTISSASASAKTFAGGGISYSGITLNQGGAGTLTITGNNTFANISNTYKATGATTINMGTTTQTVGNFTASGEAGRVLTVQGSSASSPATLIVTGSTKPNVDYLAVTGVRAYSLDETWYAGNNSVNNGSLGWIFATAATILATISNFFAFF